MKRRVALFSFLLLAIGFGVFIAMGSGGQQIAPVNRRLMLQLQSVTSSKNTDWLDAAVKQIDEQRSKGVLSEAEYAAFIPIIKKARSGDWRGAQRDSFALSERQKPTADDLERNRRREVR